MAQKRDFFMEMIGHHIDIDQSTVLEGTIRLEGGQPGFSCFKNVPEMMLKATEHCMNLRSELNYVLSYGEAIGYHRYLDELAKFLSREFGNPVSSSELMATGGTTWGISAIDRMFLGTRAPVFVSNPTFNGTLYVLTKELGLNSIPTETDENGINTDALEASLEETSSLVGNDHVTDQRPYWGLVILVPSFDNPKGVLLSQERCRKLVQLARQYNLLVVSDDIYSLLHYTGDRYPPARLITFDNKSDPDYQGNVVSVGSFSKFLSPGLRVGWIQGPPKLLTILSSTPSIAGGSVCHYTSALVASLMELGYMREHLTSVRNIYTNRLKAMSKTLDEYLPPRVTYRPTQGGYFLWIELPPNANAKDLAHLCLTKFKVGVSAGENYYLGEKKRNYVRITFGYYEEAVLVEATKKMCQAIKEYLLTLNC